MVSEKKGNKAQQKVGRKTLEKNAEVYQQKAKTLAKTARMLQKAPASRQKVTEKLQKRKQKQALKSQKRAQRTLTKAQKRFCRGKITEAEFAEFQKSLQDATNEATKIAGEGLQFAEAGVKHFLKRRKIVPAVFNSFVLNLLFLLVEIIGGALVGSTTILVCAVGDFADVFDILFAFIFQKRNSADHEFTFGYSRHLVMATLMTAVLILVGASLMIVVATANLIFGDVVFAGGMVLLGVFGLLVNGLVVFRPRKRGKLRERSGSVSLLKRSVDLAVFDDCVGWVVVLICGVAVAFTGWTVLDAVCAIIIAVYILLKNFRVFRRLLDIFLEKAPESPSVALVRATVLAVPHVAHVQKIHIWHLDLGTVCVTLHAEVDSAQYVSETLATIRQKLTGIGAGEITVEIVAQESAK